MPEDYERDSLDFVGLVLIFSFLYIVSGYNVSELKECNSDCRAVQKLEITECGLEYSGCRTECGDLVCKRICSKEKTVCVRNVNAEYDDCKKECKSESMPKCSNGTYILDLAVYSKLKFIHSPPFDNCIFSLVS